MADPVTSLIQKTNLLDWTGTKYNIHMVFTWVEHEPTPCHYLIEVHQIVAGGWQSVATIDKNIGFVNIYVGNHGPSDSWQYHQFYDQVRVTCITDPPDGDNGITTIPIVWYTSRDRSHPLANHELHHGGFQGGQLFMTMQGDEDNHHVYCANLHVYNKTVVPIREIYHRTLGEGDAALAKDYCNHIQPIIGFLISPGDTPSQGDRIQVNYTAIVGNGKLPSALNAANDGIETIWTTTFSAPVNWPLLSLSATQGNPFAFNMVNAPGISGDPVSATYSITSGSLPPGVSLASNGNISGTPSALGSFTCHVRTISSMGDPGGGDVRIVVSASQLPTITGPFSSTTLYQNLAMSFTLVCTNNPTSFAITSGTLPAGLSFNTANGTVSGTPTTLQSAIGVGFKATNVTGQGPEFIIQIAVIVLPPPVITSPSTAVAYRGETWNYQITATNAPIAFAATGLPLSATINTSTGLISGIIDAVNLPGDIVVVLRAQNLSGYSPNFNLTLTILDRIPVITSDLTVTANAFESFTYLITATGFPITFGAAGLPYGLILDPNSGLITGAPITPGTVNVTISATNSAGTGSAVLQLIIRLLRPIVDTSITSGKAITCETGIPLEFQPVATNNPTSWSCKPVPVGFTLDGNGPDAHREATGPNGLLAGTFTTVGLYGTVFLAFNAAGASDPAIFYFLVELGAGGSATNLGAGLDIWIDVQTGEVTLLAPGQTMDVTTVITENGTTTTTTGKTLVPISEAVVNTKRGDTLPVTIHFHKGGRPVEVEDLTSLIFGVREDYTSPYAVLTTGYLLNDDSSYTIWPNYSGNPEIDFEIDDEEEFIELLAEVQWETGTQDPIDDRIFTRRSSQTFKNRIYRDVINPDNPVISEIILPPPPP